MRRSGASTRQIEGAPRGATYVCPVSSHAIPYYRSLAGFLGRPDLKFVGPAFLDRGGQRYRGMDPGMIVLDHAVDKFAPSPDLRLFYAWCATHARPVSDKGTP